MNSYISDALSFSMSECAFPFEGNWNFCFPVLDFADGDVWMCLPVWRELKQIHHRDSAKRISSSECAFPFEGNWNRSLENLFSRISSSSECAFPFEGNWNPALYKHSAANIYRLNVPSRLKGIETYILALLFQVISLGLNVPSRLKGIETLKQHPTGRR